ARRAKRHRQLGRRAGAVGARRTDHLTGVIPDANVPPAEHDAGSEGRSTMRSTRWIVSAAAAMVAVAALLPGSASAAPGTWNRVSTMPVGYLAYADAARGADGRLYIVAGSSYDANTSTVRDETYAFDPPTKTWKRLANLPAPREN